MAVTSLHPSLSYRVDGDGFPIVLSHALGCSLGMWNEIAPALARTGTIVRYDTRGHGRSEAVTDAFSLDDLVGDAVRLMDALGLERVSWVGLSLGGMIGQGLAIDHPARIEKLVLANTVSRLPKEGRAQWRERARVARADGMAALAELILTRYFSAEFRQSRPEVIQRFRSGVLRLDPGGYAACCEAIAGLDYFAQLDRIACPTLAIAGSADHAATPEMVKEIADGIPGATLNIIPDAGHLSVVERPDAFLQIVSAFLQRR
jgi:3-oxoadipate enol-lactonase